MSRLKVIFVALLVSLAACRPPAPSKPTATTQAFAPTARRSPAATHTSPPIPTEPPPVTETTAPTIKPSPTTVPTPANPADVIYHNGVIITVEKSRPIAEAIAILDGLIQAVGKRDEVLALRGPDTVVIDLQGATLLPGFIEGHTHFLINALERGASWQEMMDTLAGFGLTSITEMRGHRNFINSLLQAEQRGDLAVRLNVFADYNYGFLTNGKTTIDPSWHLDNVPILEPARMVRIPGVKIFADGSGEPGRGCPFYSFPLPANITEIWPTVWDVCKRPSGDLYLSEAQLVEAIQGIQERGFRAAFHVMGDATLDAVLNALESVLAGESNAKYRHQIQHNSLIRPDQLERYQQMDILASVRGVFNTCEAQEYIALFGEDHYAWAANRYALPNLGIHAYSEGDFGRGDPTSLTWIRPLNPLLSLYGLVTHRQLRNGVDYCSPPDWIAKHKIRVERALEMLTIEPAYAISMEDYVGSLKPGKYADLVILSGNPLKVSPDGLYQLKVWMTMVGGKAIYCAPGRGGYCPKP